MTPRIPTGLSQMIGPVVVLVLWLAVGWLGLLNSLFVPTLPSVVAAAGRLLNNADLLQQLAATASRTTAGFVLAAFVGIPIGLVLGLNRPLYRVLSVLIDFLRSVPGTALFPLFLLLFGIGDYSKIANAVFASGLIIAINTIYGVQNVNPTRILAARTMGATRQKIFTSVVFPAALPAIVGGLRVAVSIALIVIVVTEMFIGTKVGLGRLIFHSYDIFEVPEMFVGIITAGLLGYGLNRALQWCEEQIVHWSGR